MNRISLILLLYFAIISTRTIAQTECTTQGQTPSSAFPVCGTDTFSQSTVPGCGGRRIVAPGCTDILNDINPFWYRFTCFEAGSLGFLITPNDLNDDYDWQLFDITNRNENDVYTDPSLFVTCNWSGESGLTGTSDAGNSLVVCASDGTGFRNPFSQKPQLIKDHEYILMVSHFTVASQSGYGLTFGGSTGGTAVITDPKLPRLQNARAICNGERIGIKLNKKMKCNSLAANGSQFTISPPVANIIAATGINCNNGFQLDSILLTLSGPIPVGDYTIKVKNSRNGINLLDLCNNTLPNGDSLVISVFTILPTPMDSMAPLRCAANEIELYFKKPLLCRTIEPTGSDFKVTNGAIVLPVVSAAGICDSNGTTQKIIVKLAAPIKQAGNYRITLQRGTDGNTLYNECVKETPVGSFLAFAASDTVSAKFNYTISYGCKTDTIFYTHNGANNINKWKWIFDNGIQSNKKDTAIAYTIFGDRKTTLIVSNGICSDTSSQTIFLYNSTKAQFQSPSFICPIDRNIFTENSIGQITNWDWTFGNGNRSNQRIPPPQQYEYTNILRNEQVILIVTDDLGCKDTLTKTVTIAPNCYIAVPKAFTPNGDGINDFLFPSNAYKARDLYFAIYNRFGQKLFETTNWMMKWDGTFRGNPQDPGAYVWLLNYTIEDTGQRYDFRGSTVLIR